MAKYIIQFFLKEKKIIQRIKNDNWEDWEVLGELGFK